MGRHEEISYHRGIYSYIRLDSERELKEKLAAIEGKYFLVDANVLSLHPWLSNLVQEDLCKTIALNAGERCKTMVKVATTIEELLEMGFVKSSTLVCIGGATLQDLSGTVAGLLYRGSKWVYVPTTGLAQIDSCIGSKTSLNIGEFKNAAGMFYPPSQVLLYDSFLDTQSETELIATFGELLHYIAPYREHREKARSHMGSCSDTDYRQIIGVFQDDVLLIKKSMIERDEFDRRERRIFNYGHSFGHAIESASGYVIPHGIAVALGMVIANRIAIRERVVEEANMVAVDEINLLCKRLLKDYGKYMEEQQPASISVKRMFMALRYDKKNDRSSSYSLILPVSKGLEEISLRQVSIDKRSLDGDIIQKVLETLDLGWIDLRA